jgi:hypothetical protein
MMMEFRRASLSFRQWFLSFEKKPNSPWNALHNPNVFQFAYFSSPHITKYTYRRMTREDLKIAKQNLRTFAVVGLTEQFSASILLLNAVFDLEAPLDVEKANEGTPHPNEASNTLTEEDVRLLKERNALDIELYEYGKQLFQEQLQQVVDRTPCLSPFLQAQIRSLGLWPKKK